MGAIERARQLVAAAWPGSTVPVEALAEVLAEVDAPTATISGAPHPYGWDVHHLGERLKKGASAIKQMIREGQFGEPETEGGPQKVDGRWYVSDAALREHERRRAGAAPTPSTPSPVPAPIARGAVDLTAARREMRERDVPATRMIA